MLVESTGFLGTCRLTLGSAASQYHLGTDIMADTSPVISCEINFTSLIVEWTVPTLRYIFNIYFFFFKHIISWMYFIRVYVRIYVKKNIVRLEYIESYTIFPIKIAIIISPTIGTYLNIKNTVYSFRCILPP